MDTGGRFTGSRRRLVCDTRADAPIIGVILMVAVTVAIATGAFVIWKILIDQNPDAAPAFGMRGDDAQDRLVLVSADSKANWNRVAVGIESQEGSATAIYMGSSSPHQNEPATVNGANVLTGTRHVSGESTQMLAPDYLAFCADVATVNVDIVVFDHLANARMGVWQFGTIAAC